MNPKITLTLTPDSAFLLGGRRDNPAYNAVTALDQRTGLPYIPATAVKGALRMDFEAFFRGVAAGGQLPVSLKDITCQLEEEAADEDGSSEYRGCGHCLTCKLFGGGNKDGILRFNSAFPEEGEGKNSLAEVMAEILPKGRREGVSISRALGKAREGSYYSLLTFPHLEGIMTLTFDASVDLHSNEHYAELDDRDRQYLKIFLAFLKAAGLTIGSGKSTGLGHFKIDFQVPENTGAPVLETLRRGEVTLYTLRLKTLEPLVIGSTKNRYIIDTMPYIPASTLGGSIGFGLVRHGVNKDTMAYLFDLKEKKSRISPYNCYVKTPFPGSYSLRESKAGEGDARDILLGDFILQRAIDKGVFGSRRFQDLYGELYHSNLRPVEISPSPEMTYITKIGIDRQLQRAGDGLLYAMETIDAGTEFRGLLIAEEWVRETLLTMKHLFIGAKRTRGYGRTLIEEIEPLKPDQLIKFTGESDRNPLDDAIKRLAEACGIDLSEDGERIFYTLDLLFDFTVPVEKIHSEPGKILFHHFREICFPGLDDIRLERAYARNFWQGGYDYREKRQKPLRSVTGAGSTFLVSIPAAQNREFREYLLNMVRHSVNFNWDNTPLFMVNDSVHFEKIGGKI